MPSFEREIELAEGWGAETCVRNELVCSRWPAKLRVLAALQRSCFCLTRVSGLELQAALQRASLPWLRKPPVPESILVLQDEANRNAETWEAGVPGAAPRSAEETRETLVSV